jgi:succinate dehydrogenase hydrophobic anchor subunit
MVTASSENMTSKLTGVVLVVLILGAMFLYITSTPVTYATGASPGTAYPPGYQAARDGLVLFSVTQTTGSTVNVSLAQIANNDTVRKFMIVGLQATSNQSGSEVILEKCSNLNNTNLSNCAGTWSTVGQYYTPVVVDMSGFPVAIEPDRAFRLRLPLNESGRTVDTVVVYLNMTP